MRRFWLVYLPLLVVVAAGCRTGGPAAPKEPGTTLDPWRELVGQRLILLHLGERKNATVTAGSPPKGSCDVAVEVTDAAPTSSGALLTLTTIGRVRVGGAPPVGKCRQLAARIALRLKVGAGGQDTARRSATGSVLLAPEAYLALHGHTFAYAAATEPTVAADTLAGDAERQLARRVVSWPKPLLTVDAAYAPPKRKQRYEAQIDFTAVVGTDGRLYRPRLGTGFDAAHQRHILTSLAFWRLEPARDKKEPLAARYDGRLIFTID
jgi:hypothetical protein